MVDCENWKLVPSELIFGISDVWATSTGRIRILDVEAKQLKGPKGKYGYYPILCKGRTLYVHRLVFFAHSEFPVETLKAGRVIFKNFEDPTKVVKENGMYRCWLEDMTFEKSKFVITTIPSEIIETKHVYGDLYYGKWMPLYIAQKRKERDMVLSNVYEICLINNSETPCFIRNKERNTFVKYHSHDGMDNYISLKNGTKSTNHQLTHIMLASAFPTILPLQTVDHIDNNPKNHNIINLRWSTLSENSKKGQSICVRKKKFHPEYLPGEIWKPLPLTDYTTSNYEVSNRGRVKRMKYGFLNGSRLRGKKYTYFTITTSSNVHIKYYAHQLVFVSFNGKLEKEQIILHDDMAPLNEDGTYRNWAEDLRVGDKTDNGREYHAAKRTVPLKNDIILLTE